MDSRKEYRLPVVIPVSIRDREKSFGNFVTRDISLRGVNINKVTNRKFKKGDLVYLQFHCDNSPYLKNYSIRASVVHYNQGNIGLLWADYDPNLFYFLQEIESVAGVQSSIKEQEQPTPYC